jgi:hypothetical protein
MSTRQHSPATASTPPQVFQPEANMLYSAVAPTKSLTEPERAMATSSRDTKLPYNYDSSLCDAFPATETKFQCYQTYYQKLVDTFGVDVAFSDLKKRYTTDSYVVTSCHPLTHVIGREAVTLYPSISEAYMHGDSFCWSGYYHGVLEAIIAKIGQANLPKEIDTICADIPGKSTYDFNYYNCVHGLGHGIMELADDDVFSSLKTCNLLTGNWEQQSCYSGVFMENVITFSRDGSAPDLKPDQPLYPCTEVDDIYKSQCYLGQTSFVLSQNGGDFKKTFDLCANVVAPYRAICDQSLGRDAANYANHDGVTTKNTCSLTTDTTDLDNCVIGAVKEFISYYHAIDQANTFCNLFSDPEKTSCLSTGKQYFRIF